MLVYKMVFNRIIHCALRKPERYNFTALIHSINRRFKNDLIINNTNETLILSNTKVTRDHLTPELKLRLITPECALWLSKATESKFSNDPFWGIYWPGGQALARYILDTPEEFYGKNIIDLGSGSGACALAAAKCGANTVLANDIDPVSIKAITINAKLNNLKIETSSQNLIGENIDSVTFSKIFKCKWDILLIGDMFYDIEFSTKLFIWLSDLVRKGKKVFIGDPGRYALKNLNQMREYGSLTRIAEYDLRNKEHNGFTSSAVYTIES